MTMITRWQGRIKCSYAEIGHMTAKELTDRLTDQKTWTEEVELPKMPRGSIQLSKWKIGRINNIARRQNAE